MTDELDERIRSLEAERLRPMPPAPEPAEPSAETAAVNRRVLMSAVDDPHRETRREKARRIRADTGSLRGVMDALAVSYGEAKRLTEEKPC